MTDDDFCRMVLSKAGEESVGETLRFARIKSLLTLRGLASKIEISPSYLSDLEHDRRRPSEELLKRIVKKVHLNFEWMAARAGIVGEAAEQYLQRNPDAVRLIRLIAGAGLTPKELTDMLYALTSILHKRQTLSLAQPLASGERQ